MTTEQRIEKLERRCRRLMVCIVGLVTVGGLALFSGAAQNDDGKHLRVESLEIVDDAGNVRLQLGRIDAPKPLDVFGFVAKDVGGNTCVAIHDLAQVNLYKGDGSVSIGADSGGASLQLASAGLQPRAMIGVGEDHCTLQLMDTNGAISWEHTTPHIHVPRELKTAGDPFSRPN
jgi:hypothetical protein